MKNETTGTCYLDITRLEFLDQAEWKCLASNDFGHSMTSCFLKLIIPKHFKKPKFLECLRAVLSEEGAVNLECKVIGVPQPILKWYKDGIELKPGDIHRITSGEVSLFLCLDQEHIISYVVPTVTVDIQKIFADSNKYKNVVDSSVIFNVFLDFFTVYKFIY